MKLLPVMFACLFLSIAYAGVAHADIEITDCGQVLLGSPERYYLTHNIIANYTGDWCIALSNHYIEIDCQGYTIDGNGTVYTGIGLGDETLFPVVRNCKIINFQFGLSFEGNSNVSVINNTFNNMSYFASSIGYQHDGGFIANNTVNNSAGGFQFGSAGGSNYVISGNRFGIDVPNALFFDGYSYVNYFVYDNYFSNGVSQIYDTALSSIYYNTAESNEINILGIPAFGGNFWGNCADINHNGFCDAAVTVSGGNIDNLPLSDIYNPDIFNATACGFALNVTGYYLLDNDVSATAYANCFDITATGITLDCNGHEINGGNYTVGAVYDWVGYSIVKNCIINDFNGGSFNTEGGYALFLNNTLKHSYGASSYPASFTTFENNTFETNMLQGIRLPTSYNVVKGNIFKYGTYAPLEILANDNLIYNNKFETLTPIWFNGGEVELWNVSADSVMNILGYNALGGNYWGSCTDANKDGYCDSPHVINGVNSDYLALSNNYVFGYGQMPPISEMNLVSTNYQCSGSDLITGRVYGFCTNLSCGTTQIDVSTPCPYGCYSGDSPNYCSPSPNQVNIYFVIIIIIMITAAAVIAKKLA